MSSTDVWHYALAIFLVLTGAGIGYALIRLAGTLQRVSTTLDGVNQELPGMLQKTSESLDHVNDELEKVGQMTGSAADAAAKVDETVRAVSDAIGKPVKKAAGFSAAAAQGVNSFRERRGRRGGVV